MVLGLVHVGKEHVVLGLVQVGKEHMVLGLVQVGKQGKQDMVQGLHGAGG